MSPMAYVVLGVWAWYLVGVVILDCIDTPERDLLRWYQSCPEEIAWFAQPLALTLWPVVAALFLYRRFSKE